MFPSLPRRLKMRLKPFFNPTLFSIQVEKFAAGLLSAGLKTDDRILICGNNHSQLVISVLGAARAGIVIFLIYPHRGMSGIAQN